MRFPCSAPARGARPSPRCSAAATTRSLLWARNPEVAEEINGEHTNGRTCPASRCRAQLRGHRRPRAGRAHAELLVMGVPTAAFRRHARAGRGPPGAVGAGGQPHQGPRAGTHLRMTQVIKQVLPGHPAAALTGPNLAKEIMAGQAAASVHRDRRPDGRRRAAAACPPGVFRVYTNHDVIGCELGGALKNVIAIAAGMADGLGVGDNTRAAVITRGLAELTRSAWRWAARPSPSPGSPAWAT